MQDLEPFYNWRGYYIAAEDPLSPFFGREYSELSTPTRFIIITYIRNGMSSDQTLFI